MEGKGPSMSLLHAWKVSCFCLTHPPPNEMTHMPSHSLDQFFNYYIHN